MNKRKYIVKPSKVENPKSSLLMSIDEAYIESKKFSRETYQPATIEECTIVGNKITSTRVVSFKVVAFVECENCLGSGFTDELNTNKCSLCDETGQEYV